MVIENNLPSNFSELAFVREESPHFKYVVNRVDNQKSYEEVWELYRLEQGKVERTVDYMKKNFFQRRHEPTLEALNQDMRNWLDQTACKVTQVGNFIPVLKRITKSALTWGTVQFS